MLRSRAHRTRLVSRLTGLAAGANFETALDFVEVSLRHHSYQAANGHGVRHQYEGLFAELHRHAEHQKADMLGSLCAQLCGAASSSAWEWSGAHRAVEHGLQALALLYLLSNTSKMVSSPVSSRNAHPRLDMRETGNLEEAEEEPTVRWGFSDEDEWGSVSATAVGAQPRNQPRNQTRNQHQPPRTELRAC